MTASPHFRRSARQPVALAVRFRRAEPGAVLEHHGRTSDIGMLGVFVEAERSIEPGTALLLAISAPSAWEPLTLPAEVRWVSDGSDGHPRGFGARFRELAEHEAAALYELLAASQYVEPE